MESHRSWICIVQPSSSFEVVHTLVGLFTTFLTLLELVETFLTKAWFLGALKHCILKFCSTGYFIFCAETHIMPNVEIKITNL